ncbi:unnamed protein product, partial [Pleuronectes platessa]
GQTEDNETEDALQKEIKRCPLCRRFVVRGAGDNLGVSEDEGKLSVELVKMKKLFASQLEDDREQREVLGKKMSHSSHFLCVYTPLSISTAPSLLISLLCLNYTADITVSKSYRRENTSAIISNLPHPMPISIPVEAARAAPGYPSLPALTRQASLAPRKAVRAAGLVAEEQCWGKRGVSNEFPLSLHGKPVRRRSSPVTYSDPLTAGDPLQDGGAAGVKEGDVKPAHRRDAHSFSLHRSDPPMVVLSFPSCGHTFTQCGGLSREAIRLPAPPARVSVPVRPAQS